MTPKPLNPLLKTALEFGPIAAFLAVYLIFRTETFRVGGTDYSGFVAVTAAFVPVFLLALAVLWRLTGRIARIQVATALMLVVFGGLGVWFNDPDLIKLKPTAIYLGLTLILGIGLLRGHSWLKFVMEDAVPLRDKGWMILTRRVTVLFFLSALANELVWRTQPEAVWVVFETLVMPIVIVAFFLSQIGLYIDHVTLRPSKPRKPANGQRRAGQQKQARKTRGVD